MVIEVILGIFAALFLIMINRKKRLQKQLFILEYGLLLAAFVYVGFALYAQNWQWLPYEIIGVGIYGLAVFLSRKFSPIWLAIGWMGHVVWDLLLHPNGHPGYVPEWYPGACLGFDLLIGGYVFWLIFKPSESGAM